VLSALRGRRVNQLHQRALIHQEKLNSYTTPPYCLTSRGLRFLVLRKCIEPSYSRESGVRRLVFAPEADQAGETV
jgi:hypothetical protein